MKYVVEVDGIIRYAHVTNKYICKECRSHTYIRKKGIGKICLACQRKKEKQKE